MAFFGPGEAIVVLIALELCLRLSNSLAGVKLLCFCERPFLAGGGHPCEHPCGVTGSCGYQYPTRSCKTCSHSAM